jgi:IS4 transposase
MKTSLCFKLKKPRCYLRDDDLEVNVKGNVFTREYVDYKRLYKIHLCGALSVTRAKVNLSYKCVLSHPKDRSLGVVYDQSILLTNHYASKDYPIKMRRIKFMDEATGSILIFLTNNFHLKATEIALLNKHRCKIELFFKWIKQHLKIKSF